MHPVLVSIGPKHLNDGVINEAIKIKEAELGRPLNSTEVLHVVGECYEPDESKRLFLGTQRPATLPKLWLP